ncbi:dynamin-related protein 1E [Iris pallida]|uniref:Dynamin-related protein 1E n=1 Tax=Iris pallida TaxID=29817 RepID=A0AAX6DHH7_IRIPA|nr:dynamin-related protein 1E [Iris pallida]KAJ6810016.1 dynamin-related protein 1E [Iris pallida]
MTRVISQADNYHPHLIAPDQGYRHLIEGALSYLWASAEAFVNVAVYAVANEGIRLEIPEGPLTS